MRAVGHMISLPATVLCKSLLVRQLPPRLSIWNENRRRADTDCVMLMATVRHVVGIAALPDLFPSRYYNSFHGNSVAVRLAPRAAVPA